jgi:YD repeat-containing protein
MVSNLPEALSNGTTAYAYDVLGRVASRAVAGQGAESFGYDAIGRLTSRSNDLGTFTLSYLGQTTQVATRRRIGSTLATAWTHLPNSGDRRLAGIASTSLSADQFSNFTFATTGEDFITSVAESSDQASRFPTAGTQTALFTPSTR